MFLRINFDCWKIWFELNKLRCTEYSLLSIKTHRTAASGHFFNTKTNYLNQDSFYGHKIKWKFVWNWHFFFGRLIKVQFDQIKSDHELWQHHFEMKHLYVWNWDHETWLDRLQVNQMINFVQNLHLFFVCVHPMKLDEKKKKNEWNFLTIDELYNGNRTWMILDDFGDFCAMKFLCK